jgi:hypothetical protein
MTDLKRAMGLYGRGDRRPVRAGDFDAETVKDGVEVPVWNKEVPNDKIAFFGHGPHQRAVAEAFIDLDLVASGAGAGTAGDPIEGELIAAIVDSEERRVVASVTIEDLDQLRDAQNEERTDRPVMEALDPYAKPGRYIQFRIRSTSNSDGYEIDPSASSGTLYHTMA